VVHVHSPFPAPWVRLVVRSLPPRDRPALVYTEHNRWAQYAWPTRTLNRLTYGLDDWQIAVSEGVRDSVAPHRRAGVEVLVHGIVLDAVAERAAARAEVRAGWGVDDDTVVAGTVANLRAEKGYHDLLAAAALVDAGGPVRFVAIGQGPLEEELRAAHARAGLGARFRFLGYQPDAVRLMAGFDVFVLASHHEGLPVAVMEAAALGLPVVATAVGGLPEAVLHDETGLLVAPHRPVALAAAIEALASDPGRRAALGNEARARAGRFDAARAVAHLESGYRRLAAGRR
jgi:glycosyltransferase involved in cell wall biosynthesis